MTRRGLAASLLAAALLAAGCTGDPYVAPPPATTSEVADPAAAAATVSALQDAVGAGDTAAGSALGADPRASELLAAVVSNASELGLSDVTFRYVAETGRTSGADGWDGLVAVTWRLDGVDSASARTEVAMSFADHGRRIAAIGGDGRLPLWLAGPVAVRRVPGAVVAVAEPAERIDRYARWARTAVARAREVLGGQESFAVEVAADSAGMHRALGAEPRAYDAVAAITAPVDGSRAPGSPVHVFVNPAVYDGLDPVAAQVVMTHEAVHALTDATRADAPLWLVEGFADHVALRGLDLPDERTAGQVIRQVRRDGLPAALPSDTDFNPSVTHLGAVYEAAWQVAATLADARGEDALVRLYRAVLDGTDLVTALRAGYGWTVADLTAAWRSRLAALAGVSE
ncbi:MAG TPA: hypothetical protein VNS81_09560 [Nocardioides sp.]|nr:hypothetical protein [Nocardioides sp.]